MTMRVRWAPVALGLLALAPAPLSAETYTDEQLGYSFAVPDGYRAIPIAGEEQYIVAKWQSEREYVDKKEGWSHRPELKVVLFDPKGKKTAEVSKEDEGVARIAIKNPYRSYKDWVKSDAQGGRYISKEEETTVNGVATTWFEVAYEKLTVPRHGVAFVYHAPDIDYCITTEVLEQHWDKLGPPLIKALKSFKLFARKGTVKREVTGDDDVLITKDISKLTPEERLKRRTSVFEKNLRLATERLTDGWYVKRSKNYVALSHASQKYTQAILDQAEAVREWAEATFGYIGTGLAGPEMFRVCKDYDEERSFRDLSSRSGWTSEITCSQNEGFFALGNVGGEIFDRWLRDKNQRLSSGMPPWLGNGIREWVGSAYLKGSKLEFRADGDLIVALKLAVKAKKLIGPHDMLLMSSGDLTKSLEEAMNAPSTPNDMAWRTSPWQQAAGLVRYLLAGPGKSSPRTKDLLRAYILALDEHLGAADAKPREMESGPAAPKTEAEEEERFKNKQQYWKDHEKDLLKAVFDKVFRDWTEADWAAFEKSYKSYAG